VITEVLQGKRGGAAAEFFCMNAAAALYIADRATSYREGAEMAREALESGAAWNKLEAMLEYQGAGTVTEYI
jgi:anthranilate phosphoribosyltransferase